MSVIPVRVTPRAAKPGIAGWRKGADGRAELQVRVAESPADGAANAAVVRVIARALAIPKSQVAIRSGHASRHKLIEVPVSADELRLAFAGH